MGWGRTLLLGDIGNRLDIEDTERDISILMDQLNGSFEKNMSQDRKIAELISENAQLKLYLAALIRLLKSNKVITEAELVSMIDSIDPKENL